MKEMIKQKLKWGVGIGIGLLLSIGSGAIYFKKFPKQSNFRKDDTVAAVQPENIQPEPAVEEQRHEAAMVFLPPNLVEAEVKDYSDEQRQKVLTEALRLMIIRNGSVPNALSLPKVQQILDKPDLYLQQFSYAALAVGGVERLRLRVMFNVAALEQLLRSASDVTWVAHHPLVLVWLCETTGNMGGVWTGENSNRPGVQELQQLAPTHGLRLIFPLLDFQEVAQLKAAQGCQLDLNKLELLSQRYGAAVVAVGTVNQSKPASSSQSVISDEHPRGEQKIDWTLLRKGATSSFSVTGSQRQELAQRSVQELANRVGKILTAVPKQATSVKLRVTNILGMEQYQAVQHYLSTFSRVVMDVELVKLNSGEAEFLLEVAGGGAALRQALREQENLLPNQLGEEAASAEAPLDYQWVGGLREALSTTDAQSASPR